MFGPGGGYTPLDVGSDAFVAFTRSDPDGVPAAITIVATWRSTDGQSGEVVLPDGRWRDVLRDDAPIVELRQTTDSLWSGAAQGVGCAVLERVVG